jgi:ABC-2 type transport system ATP-binding protein
MPSTGLGPGCTGGNVNEQALVLKGVSKYFADHVAVKDLSLDVPRGSVFGLLGPNGAGKTTTLRMVMNILGADAGSIEILGRPADQATRDRIGYMPEERGLYPRMVLEEQLIFMASIKGLGRKEAADRLSPWLERLGLADWRKRKTNELSKGMQQKAQFIATVLHEPELLIMDEPMSGLDPVGMDVMRDVMVDLSRRGATIVLSSHQMDTVEKLCDRVALINKGEKVLDGSVGDVKARHGQNTLVLAFEGDGAFLASLPGVARLSDFGQYVEIRLSDGADPQSILREATRQLTVRRFEIVVPSLHDVFVETVTGSGKEAA